MVADGSAQTSNVHGNRESEGMGMMFARDPSQDIVCHWRSSNNSAPALTTKADVTIHVHTDAPLWPR
jgi:hypothetical protein